ncbi:MAG: RagB/SusD family nutrient uptake outer membrane protein [Balneolaceae bacterium]
MNNRIKKLLLLSFTFSFGALFIASCDDFLSQELVDEAPGSYLSTEEGFEDGVTACYSHLRRIYGAEQPAAFMTTYGTDLWEYGFGGDFGALGAYDLNLNPRQSDITNVWNWVYEGINTCNAVISRAEEVEVDEVRLAEARFVRAVNYFFLVRQYGGVHITLEETTGLQTEATRASVSDVYDVIINDLTFALNTLPDVQSDYGRATKPATEHMLAIVHLTRAGHDEAAQPDDYELAADYAKNVIENYHFQLMGSWEELFDISNQRNDEIVWSIQNSSNPQTRSFGGNRMNNWFLPRYETAPAIVRTTELGRAWSRFRPTQWMFFDLYDREVDGRAEAMFQRTFYVNDPGEATTLNGYEVNFQEGDTALYFPLEPWTDVQIADAGYSVLNPGVDQDGLWTGRLYPREQLKHPDPTRPDPFDSYSQRDWNVARLAETHLIAAEAIFMSGGDLAEAAEHINIVRRRAAAPGVDPSEMEITPDQIDLDFILDERGRELNAEMHRWHDLARTGTLIDRVLQYSPGQNRVENIRDFHILRPIPQDQIDRTSTDFPQNPGYN